MSIEAMKQALEALDEAIMLWREEMEYRSAIDAADPWEKAANTLRLAIQKEEALSALIAESQALGAYDVPKAARREPVAYQDTAKHDELVSAGDWNNIDPQWHWMYRPLYTAPPQRQPLTEWQIIQTKATIKGTLDVQFIDFARAIERKHGIGGEA